MQLPQNNNDELSLKLWTNEIYKLKRKLEETFDVEITDEKLRVEKLYHIDGGLKEIPFTYENGKITFKTNHYQASCYLLAYFHKLLHKR